jgi:aspartyl-tRNA(Asn)/glutamyl-tRNA(Gln) amidotransferase subunit B
VFETMIATGRPADAIVAAEGLARIDDESAIASAVRQVIEANADAVAQYRAGKQQTFGFLVGQVMKATRGKANPARVNELMRRLLDQA